MTDYQLFRLLGILYLAIGFGMLSSSEHYKRMVRNFADSPAALYLGGFAATIVGYLIVVFHNEWSLSWSVLITLIGWLALVKGLTLLVFPGVMSSLMLRIENVRHSVRWFACSAIALGMLMLALSLQGNV